MKFPEMSHEYIKSQLMPRLGKVDCVLDTDTYNEVDDQFAIVWALKHPERLNLQAIYAAPFSHGWMGLKPEDAHGINYAATPAEGMEQSYEEILRLFKFMDLDPTGLVYRGSTEYVGKDLKPVDSPAARDLVERAMARPDGDPLYVIAIGAITNVVSAILMEPEIIKKIVIVWMGGQPLYFDQCFEFNLAQDVPAVQLMFDCGVPIVYVPGMHACSQLTITPAELERYVIGKSAVGTYLGEFVMQHIGPEHDPMAAQRKVHDFYLNGESDVPDEILDQFDSQYLAHSRIIWDLAPVAWVLNPGWAPSTIEVSPRIADNCDYLPKDESRHPIRAVNYCQRDLVYGDFFKVLAD